jgi:hypothetical protein
MGGFHKETERRRIVGTSELRAVGAWVMMVAVRSSPERGKAITIAGAYVEGCGEVRRRRDSFQADLCPSLCGVLRVLKPGNFGGRDYPGIEPSIETANSLGDWPHIAAIGFQGHNRLTGRTKAACASCSL